MADHIYLVGHRIWKAVKLDHLWYCHYGGLHYTMAKSRQKAKVLMLMDTDFSSEAGEQLTFHKSAW